MRGHYELAYKGIMGYGTPDYPDEGLTSSTASEVLSKAQEIGKMMVEEKWVYSNTDLKGSLAAAEQSAKRKTVPTVSVLCFRKLTSEKRTDILRK